MVGKWVIVNVAILALISSIIWWYIAVRDTRYSIAVVWAPSMHFHGAMYTALATVIGACGKGAYRLESRAVSNLSDPIQVTAVCEQVLQHKHDLIVVVGRACSQTLINLAKKREAATPILFIGAGKPVELGIIESLEAPGGMATGILPSGVETRSAACLLKIALPQVTSVLIPYFAPTDAVGEVYERACAVQAYGDTHGFVTKIVPLDNMHTALQIVEGLLPGHEVLMTIESDVFGVAQTPALNQLVKRYQKILFSGDIEAATEGALLTFATQPRYLAEAAFWYIQQIIDQKVIPGELPVMCMDSSREFIINQTTAQASGVTFDMENIMNEITKNPALKTVQGKVRSIL